MAHQTLTNYSHQALAQAVKSVHDLTPIKSAATPQNKAFRLLRWLYSLFGKEMPIPDHQISDMEEVLDKQKPEILKILSSIKLKANGDLVGAPGMEESSPFEFEGLHYKFVQLNSILYLTRLELISNTGNSPVYRECGSYEMAGVTPTKLKSEAIRGYIASQSAAHQQPDLTKINLFIVDDITKFNFSGTAISPINLHQIEHAAQQKSAKAEHITIDLRGADLLPEAGDWASKVDLSRFLFDARLAMQLIEQGADYQKVFAQYVHSQQVKEEFGFDIASFDLSKVSCAGMDLRNANFRPVIYRNDPAEFASLKNAKLPLFVAESIQIGRSPVAILTKPEIMTSRNLNVTGPHQFLPQEFVSFAYELGQRHENNEALGNIALRNFRSHAGNIYFLKGREDDRNKPVPQVQFSAEFLEEFQTTAEELDLGAVHPKQLSGIKKDQYDFFGVLIQAVTGKTELQLLPPNDRYDLMDIRALYDKLPCDLNQKADWLKFMEDPEHSDLNTSLHVYLLKPDTSYKGLAAAKTEWLAKESAASERLKPNTAAVPKAKVNQSPAKSTVQSAPKKAEFFEIAKRNGFKFDVSQFTRLAATLQASITPEKPETSESGEGTTGDEEMWVSRLKYSLVDSIRIDNNEVRLNYDQMKPTLVSSQNLITVQKGTQLEFFGAMIKAGVTNPEVRSLVTVGTADWNFSGQSWERQTAIDMVNLLPCERELKIQLAQFLVDPKSCSLNGALADYLSAPLGLLGGPVQITVADIESAASDAVQGATVQSGAAKVLPPTQSLVPPVHTPAVPPVVDRFSTTSLTDPVDY